MIKGICDFCDDPVLDDEPAWVTDDPDMPDFIMHMDNCWREDSPMPHDLSPECKKRIQDLREKRRKDAP